MRSPTTAMQKMNKKDRGEDKVNNGNCNEIPEVKSKRKRCKNEIQECVRIFQVKKKVLKNI